ncbi:hypothetical protein HDA40_001978 [Hamadaea flava]|uniref:Uncharacterized protein n=1 Tax=Hamadaea flava TaxID=1742688 RepID=A0ABV8LXP5_9ACTN|nr:hypothetical protein [Hamadaea flava]MCP2323471.1 hypothetical protein [Hamadaea flava]
MTGALLSAVLPAVTANAATTEYGIAVNMQRDGAPVPLQDFTTAEVRVRIWPSSDYLSNLADDSPVPVLNWPAQPIIGTTEIAITPDDLVAAGGGEVDYIGADGVVDAEAQVIMRRSDGQANVASASFSMQNTGTDWESVQFGQAVALTVDFSQSSPTAALAGYDTLVSLDENDNPVTESAAALDVVASAVYDPGTVCSTTAKEWYYGRSEHWDSLNTVSGISMQVEMDAGASNTLGVGVNLDSKGWKGGGTASKTVQSGAGASITRTTATTFYNKVNYRRFVEYCHSVGYTWENQYMRPMSFNDIIDNAKLYTGFWNPPATCATKSSGSYSKTKGSNISWSSGIDAHFLSVSAQASYSTNTKVTWTFGRTGRLCGTSAAGWADSAHAGAWS